MPTYVYPTSNTLFQIEQDFLPRLQEGRDEYEFMPIVNQDSAYVSWEQLDNFTGLQNLRGLNGPPVKVRKTGAKRYLMEPGAYGDYEVIDEIELTQRRRLGDFGQPIDITDLVTQAQVKLLQRELDRISASAWTLFSMGTFSVVMPYGAAIGHTDTYSIQTYTAPFLWSNYSLARPLYDFRQVQLLAAGHSVSFGADARAYMRRQTFNDLMANSNNQDFFGKRIPVGSTINDLGSVNKILAGEDLPQIRIKDDGYYTDADSFTYFLPLNKVVVIGRRVGGGRIAEYRMVRNANNPDAAPGPYTKVIDRGETVVPRSIEVHRGHNGGTAMLFPSAVVAMNV